MTKKDLADLRIANQQIMPGKFTTPRELAAWMGAMQAQDFRMVRWAFGLRIPGSTIDDIDKAINDGEIIRTHLLRPTWHFVSADDLRWMLGLSAPKIKPTLRYRQDFLGLTPQILNESNDIISEILKGKHLDREQIRKELNKGGIATDNNNLSHLLLWAELSGIICSGKIVKESQTYALISERIPAGKQPERKEALGMLAIKYFKSHGPATLKDFGWWSGLIARDIRTALEAAGDELENTEIDSVKYWYGKGQQPVESVRRAWLVPAFDEIIISYTDRSAFMSSDTHLKAVSSNGVFRSVLVIENQVTGLWRPVKSKDRIIVEINPFGNPGKAEKREIEIAAAAYGSFMQIKPEVKFI